MFRYAQSAPKPLQKSVITSMVGFAAGHEPFPIRPAAALGHARARHAGTLATWRAAGAKSRWLLQRRLPNTYQSPRWRRNAVMARWSRYDLIAIDNVGYVPLAEVGAEGAETNAVIVTTNLPFSEWTQVIPSARLCKAVLNGITDPAHILETGTESYRFRRSINKQKKGERASAAK